jgi:hypothetical protein
MDHIKLILGPCRVHLQCITKYYSLTTMRMEVANCPSATLVPRDFSKDWDHQQNRCENLKSRNTWSCTT